MGFFTFLSSKSYLLKYKKFFKFEERKFHFPKCKKKFLEKDKKFIRVDFFFFFFFLNLGLKVCQVALKSTAVGKSKKVVQMRRFPNYKFWKTAEKSENFIKFLGDRL